MDTKLKIILIADNDNFFDFKFLNNFKVKKLNECKDDFNAEIILVEKSEAEQVKNIPAELIESAFLVFNYDDENLRKICQNIDIKKVSFGFSEKADFKASDVNELEDSTNFKINYNGNTVPVWLKKLSGKSEIYNFLSAICIGSLLGLNIIEMLNSF